MHKRKLLWGGPQEACLTGRIEPPGSLWDAELMDTASVNPMAPPETDLICCPSPKHQPEESKTLYPHDLSSSSVP